MEDCLFDPFGFDDDYQHGDAGHPVDQPMRVFRVEMPDGLGPFNSLVPDGREVGLRICREEPGFNCCALAHENHERMDITDHAFHKAHGHADYACDSLQGVKRWFKKPAREYLAKHGARIVEYEIPVGGYVAVIGNNEVIFNRFEGKKVAEHDIAKGEKNG